MADGPAPLELLRRMEEACEGEPIDEIIFCCGILIGQLITHIGKPEHYEDIIQGYMDAIRAGITGVPTEH